MVHLKQGDNTNIRGTGSPHDEAVTLHLQVATMEALNFETKKYHLVSQVGLAVMHRLLDGDQLIGLQGVTGQDIGFIRMLKCCSLQVKWKEN